MRSHFHYVSCLSEAKGMDISMEELFDLAKCTQCKRDPEKEDSEIWICFSGERGADRIK